MGILDNPVFWIGVAAGAGSLLLAAIVGMACVILAEPPEPTAPGTQA